MENIFRYYNIINKHANVYLDNALEPFDLSSHHRTFIHKIVEQPGITRDKIKNMVHIHPSNTTRIIDYLEECGYVTKKVTISDKRICELYPTESLIKVYDVLTKAENEWVKIITEGLNEEEIEKYNELLKKSCELSISYIHKGE